MELRWVIKQNEVTAQMVEMYCERHLCSRADAKRLLENRSKPVLQYRQGMGYDWQDTPTVVVPHED